MAKSKKLNKKFLWVVIAVVVVWLISVLIVYLRHANFAVLNPRGVVALREKRLIITTVILGMLVVVPVFVMTAVIAWRYREGNKNATYSPELAGNWLAETVWWGVPALIILVLSVITWNSSHSLDPHKALASSVKPLKVQVVALDWKWLFIYPDQDVAAVNQLGLPVGKPVHFDITSDAPMNSFWIPQLGSQIYAMPGMKTHLNLMADKAGDYAGSSANISGRGFSGMDFTATAWPNDGFENWLRATKQSPLRLDAAAYRQLSRPSTEEPVTYYSSVDKDLFDKVVNKYMTPGASDVR